ncbi:uncharacterized protein LOC131892274 [Tigriopus californicus]|uniref:uncharacterized protein LOC131892274 n=1 Tax=Tigriopus californicus TaxID=6832 RepID=UPI0027DAB28E|nr:uncharacterized protein LOC131892274 [Tigriopus californicus]
MNIYEWKVIYFAAFLSHSMVATGQLAKFSGTPFDPVKAGIATSTQSQFGCPLVTNRALEPLIRHGRSPGLFSFDGLSVDRRESYIMSIRRSEGCIVGLVFGSNPVDFGLVADLTERIPNSKLIVMGASNELIATINRQVVVLVEDPIAKNVKVNIFCGRQSGAYWSKNVNLWTPGRGFKKAFDWNRYCRNILDRQRFVVGHSGLNPMVMLPKKPGDKIRGVEVDAIKLFGQKHNLNVEFIHGQIEASGADLNRSKALLGQLYRGKIDLALTVVLHVDGYRDFACTSYTDTLELKYCTRRPQKLVAFGNLGRGFDFWSWISVFTCLSLFSITFALIFHVYKSLIRLKTLYKNPGHPMDFLLLTFTAFVEPDPLVWFPSWSSGKLLFVLWSIFSFFVTSFFNSNLRSNLIAPSLEPKVETTDDFLNSGRDLLLLDLLGFLLKQKSGTGFQRFLDYVEDNPSSLYSLNDDLDAVTDKIMSGGAVIICPKDSEMTNYPTDPVNMGLPNRYFSRESIFSGFMANRLRKYSPYLPYLNTVIERFRESGLHQRALYEQLPLVALPGQFKPDQNENGIRMSLDMMWMALFILGGGIILGMVAFIFEKVMDMRKRSIVGQ